MGMADRGQGVDLRLIQGLFAAGTTGDLTDAQLLERFLTGRDEAGFEALVLRHGAMVVDVCHHVLRNAHDARGCVSGDVFGAGIEGAFDPPVRLSGELALWGGAAGVEPREDRSRSMARRSNVARRLRGKLEPREPAGPTSALRRAGSAAATASRAGRTLRPGRAKP